MEGLLALSPPNSSFLLIIALFLIYVICEAATLTTPAISVEELLAVKEEEPQEGQGKHHEQTAHQYKCGLLRGHCGYICLH